MKPQREIRDVKYENYTRKLFQTFITFSDSLEAERFLKEILTESEMIMLKRRWYVSCLLNEGYNVRQAAQKAGTSTQTIQAIKRYLSKAQIWKDFLPKPKKQPVEEPAQNQKEQASPQIPKDPTRKYIFG